MVKGRMAQEVIKKLKNKGYTKWRIAKKIGVHWNTVNIWEKGAFRPTDEHYQQLQEMLNN